MGAQSDGPATCPLLDWGHTLRILKEARVKVLSVVGARPQFVKLAPIARSLQGRADHVIVHTGQHYDELMSDVFFRDLDIPHPDVNLAIGSGPHGAQTAAMIAGLEPLLEQHAPDWVLVYGDTNSTLAAAIASVKLHLRVAHLEAGLRSHNRRMPEEHNRVLTDHASDLLLAPTEVAMGHLREEGLARRSVLVGDVMTDILFRVRDTIFDTGAPNPLALSRGSYYVVTLHRPDNTDDAERLASLVATLGSLDRPTVLVAHPRLRARAAEFGIELARGNLRLSPPLSYPELIAAVMDASGVITDSGGLQKEAFLLKVPTTTIRRETEWTETVMLGGNVLAYEVDEIAAAVTRVAPDPRYDDEPYGDGRAAVHAVQALLDHHHSR